MATAVLSGSALLALVGDYRVTYDVIDTDGVILVLGIVDRGDLERWIRSR